MIICLMRMYQLKKKSVCQTWLETEWLKGVECWFDCCQQTHAEASTRTQSQRMMMASSRADVTLISGVTDCWKQGHLLTFYFCPLLFFVPSICFFCSDLSSHTVPLSWLWSSLSLVVAKKWAQLSVPFWPLAHTDFLTLFKWEVCHSIKWNKAPPFKTSN